MVRCRCCGREIRSIQELRNVQNVGLKMCGECPGCGNQVVCNAMWKAKKLLEKVVGNVR